MEDNQSSTSEQYIETPIIAKNFDFKITISDSHCAYQYKLNISTKNSIDSIMNKIYNAFGVEPKNGKMVKGLDSTKFPVMKLTRNKKKW